MKGKHLKGYPIQLRFLTDNKKRINLLYLYCRLRRHSIDFAGYIPKNVFESLTHHQKFVLIPKMRSLGWLDENNKLNSITKILAKSDNIRGVNIFVDLDFHYLENIKKFKSFILASIEAYILRGKLTAETKGYYVKNPITGKTKRQRVVRSDAKTYATQKISKGGGLSSKNSVSDTLSAPISHSMLSNWGYSTATISRLRKEKINKYERILLTNQDKFNDKVFFSSLNKCYCKFLPTRVSCSFSQITRRGSYLTSLNINQNSK